MAKDDLPVIIYKLLEYIYACMKGEIEPTVEQAKELCACNETMFDAAVVEAIDNGFVRGIERKFYYSGPEILFSAARLTLKGSEYLLENSTMSRAKDIAGEAFRVALTQAIAIGRRVIGL